MRGPDNPSSIIELEYEILRRLCQPYVAEVSVQPLSNSREKAILELVAHRWQGAEHRIVFEALTKLPGRDAAELQRQLPAQATRMGFPDVDWEAYFANDSARGGNSVPEETSGIETLIARLRAASQRAAS